MLTWRACSGQAACSSMIPCAGETTATLPYVPQLPEPRLKARAASRPSQQPQESSTNTYPQMFFSNTWPLGPYQPTPTHHRVCAGVGLVHRLRGALPPQPRLHRGSGGAAAGTELVGLGDGGSRGRGVVIKSCPVPAPLTRCLCDRAPPDQGLASPKRWMCSSLPAPLRTHVAVLDRSPTPPRPHPAPGATATAPPCALAPAGDTSQHEKPPRNTYTHMHPLIPHGPTPHLVPLRQRHRLARDSHSVTAQRWEHPTQVLWDSGCTVRYSMRTCCYMRVFQNIVCHAQLTRHGSLLRVHHACPAGQHGD